MHIVFFGSGGSALVARFLGEKKQKTRERGFLFSDLCDNRCGNSFEHCGLVRDSFFRKDSRRGRGTSSLFCSLRENALPVLLGTAGIWLASPGAELFCLVMTAGCFFGFRKKYNY